MKTLVLGIGNTLLTDEGVGVHVLQALEPELGHRDDVTLLDGGTLSFTLAGPIEEADALIVVDAANIKTRPGEWALLEGNDMDAFLMANRKASVHEVGLTDLRAIALLAGHWPAKRAMLAIQPAVIDWGEAPTPAVAAAIPPVCAAIVEQIRTWNHVA
ncbi:HyaD/HybD family hydrogenase maturation endopeptidase [Thiobacillus sedimenti]|uniref:HyaD/HybD family hydrogenase maturation endopeptidase n=1 Tax=Thiobacillus sedimenti TaxID=3110231 RepID=A0ABZ1CMI7_9PROT|nr:HyaD/HybD family hydrogenase maturation endopeptidase [Thiobacillus sp. SCUT-2]WRS40569.1 HyaD/HybD family hydrogenase maturation endopeptidase [Thiobacillus sp. SCUT-2]